MSLKLLAYESCFHSQQRIVAAFLVQQIRVTIRDMHSTQGSRGGRGRGRGEGRGRDRGEAIQHNRDRAALGDLSNPASALGEAQPDFSNNWGRDAVRRGSSLGARSQIAGIHQNRNKGSFGGLTNPTSALGETKPNSTNRNGGHDEVEASSHDEFTVRAALGDLSHPATALGEAKSVSSNNWGRDAVRQGSSLGARSQIAVRNKGSFGGLPNPTSALGETKANSTNRNGGHDEVEASSHDEFRVSRGSYVDACDQIVSIDTVKSDYVNADSNARQEKISTSSSLYKSDRVNRVGQSRNVRHENFATSNSYRGSESSRGRGGHGRRWNEGKPSENDRIDALGRTLVRILRHQASELGLKMREDGFIEVMDLLRLPIKTGVGLPLSSHTIEHFHQAVKQDNKQRLGIIEEDEKLWIRANQGHSLKTINSDKLLKPIESAAEIQVCVHGTYKRFLSSILETGLRTMDRKHIHFAMGLPGEDGVISGMRKTCEILIYLDVARALSDNMKLYISENRVILTEGFGGVVPPIYFAKAIKWPEGTQIPLQKFQNPASSVDHE
ncbi:hypothetical protein O6H91_05G033100 [Diphasiastrum complanatum]|uniref:Uncharacterized protein n=1 Tax=Diphasiastrum complanatum TaxID=34168 RepID=A0ACC2DM74_DIPCM|nr:hypothetical protein O6H91_05G033100 [Diphasiastrum complanatum]